MPIDDRFNRTYLSLCSASLGFPNPAIGTRLSFFFQLLIEEKKEIDFKPLFLDMPGIELKMEELDLSDIVLEPSVRVP